MVRLSGVRARNDFRFSSRFGSRAELTETLARSSLSLVRQRCHDTLGRGFLASSDLWSFHDRLFASSSQKDKATGWSEADKRTFIITFYGGLAANIGVVLVVGAAIALDRFIFVSHAKPTWVLAVIVAISFVASFAIGLLVAGRGLKIRWVFIIIYGLAALLVFLGYAAGIGK